jgi:hypothetical protein
VAARRRRPQPRLVLRQVLLHLTKTQLLLSVSETYVTQESGGKTS